VVICAVLAALAAAARAPAPAAGTTEPAVLIVGDSVATGMSWHDDAIAAMQKNLAVYWDIAICRTVSGVSCPFDGQRPPTLLDLVGALGRVPPIVVVELGYNDDAAEFAASVDDAMRALVHAGAQHVLWLTLHAVRDPYTELNAVLREATTRWRSLELVDWDTAAQGHPEWFQNDGVHLLDPGGLAMAHLVHAAVVRDVDPLRVVTRLHLRRGRGYVLRLRAAGGTPPYRWAVLRGRPPRGFHLNAQGDVVARPYGPPTSFTLVVTDADGATAHERVVAS
jgi:hypothetical protein